jgi:mono/diheme cytochrome c family protein
VVGIIVACILGGYATYWGVKLFPVLPPTSHMLVQPKLAAQRASEFFADGMGMRLPVAGTVARGYLPYLWKTQEEAAALGNPLPRTADVLARGKKVFMEHCVPCHGPLGDGTTSLTSSYTAKPGNLLTALVRNYSDGMIYHTATAGKNAMPSYAADLSEDERWAVVHYIRVLQRAQNATDEDLKR